ncbi:MAG: capsule assembly Wzi family protein [Candidatus Eisenbacteria bacterium]
MRRSLVCVAALVCSICGLFADGRSYPTEPSASWVYPYLYELRLRHQGGPMFVSTGPYERGDIARWLDECSRGDSIDDGRSAYLARMLKREFEPEIRSLRVPEPAWTGNAVLRSWLETRGSYRQEALVRFALYPGPGLCVWTALRSTVNAREYHKIETVPWGERTRASFDQGGISVSRGGFSVFLGRDELSWGASREDGLLFSGSAPSLDMLKLGLRGGRLKFTSFHSQLRAGGEEAWDESVRRFVSGHRLEVLLGRRLSLAISEAVLYGGEGRNFEPAYFNPFTVLYAEQWNSDWNDNILIAGDLSFLFPGRAEIRAEIMIDDFQYDFETEPHEVAAGLTVLATNPLKPDASLIGGSYFHVTNRTYGHVIDLNRFVQEGHVIGYPGGPDGDKLKLWCTAAFPDPLLWTLDYTFRRDGEGEATDSLARTGSKAKFPTGVVWRRHCVGFDITWRPAYFWSVGGRIEWSDDENYEHIEGRARSSVRLVVSSTFHINMASKQ